MGPAGPTPPPGYGLGRSTASAGAHGALATGRGCPDTDVGGRQARRRQARHESGRRGSLLAMKSLHESIVVAIAGLESEWTGAGLARMCPMKYAEICKKMQIYVKICTTICN